jgi:hypothetical protein
MFTQIFKKIALTTFLFLLLIRLQAQEADKIVIVIIDGARYTETLGDSSKTYTPVMWDLAKEGSVASNFNNDKYTYTSRAIPALWCGAWTELNDVEYQGSTTQSAVLPTLFEYYRKLKNMPANECYYVLKYIPNLWLPSFDPDYGPDYWPEFHSIGDNDTEVATEALRIMDSEHPHFMLVYLADVDHEGHSGVWSRYTKAVHTSDSLVGVLWDKIQSDDFYKNTTSLIVTNDHGRHDDEHGGFRGHGDGCEGCRHIEFLALGPNIKQNFVTNTYHRTPDMAVTASSILGIQPTKSTGRIIQEIFNTTQSTSLQLPNSLAVDCAPNPFTNSISIRFTVAEPSWVNFSIYSLEGKHIATLMNGLQLKGQKELQWLGKDLDGQNTTAGIYFYRLKIGDQSITGKLIRSRTN